MEKVRIGLSGSLVLLMVRLASPACLPAMCYGTRKCFCFIPELYHLDLDLDLVGGIYRVIMAVIGFAVELISRFGRSDRLRLRWVPNFWSFTVRSSLSLTGFVYRMQHNMT